MAFDLLYLDGHDLRDLPLIERKRALQDVLAKAPAKISYADFVELQDSGREGWLDPLANPGTSGRQFPDRNWKIIRIARTKRYVGY
jgi:hypothetical protein